MRLPDKFNPLFDKFLLGGLGCGFLVLCILLGGFFYVWQNPPGPRSASTQLVFGDVPTVTPGSTSTPLFQFATPSAFPTGIATQAGAQGTVIPSPVPQFDDSPPIGKIVFTCFVKQIDQICLMNADGTGRKQLADFDGTAFYASISAAGDTIYFSSRKGGGSFQIYSMNLKGKSLKRLTGNIGSVYA